LNKKTTAEIGQGQPEKRKENIRLLQVPVLPVPPYFFKNKDELYVETMGI
jgi:hypothetical protein